MPPKNFTKVSKGTNILILSYNIDISASTLENLQELAIFITVAIVNLFHDHPKFNITCLTKKYAMTLIYKLYLVILNYIDQHHSEP